MQLFIHLTVPGIDTQMDGYLEGGTIPRVDGPDRAYLHYTYRSPRGLESEEIAALWLIDKPSAKTLQRGLDTLDPQLCDVRPWRVTWIRDGVIAVRRQAIGLDRAMWLLDKLGSQQVLERETHLFGSERVDVGDIELG